MIQDRNDLIAQWAFDTRPILGRFHLWLENVEVEWVRGLPAQEFAEDIAFLNGSMERLFAMTGAVTALGTQLFGRFGEGAGLDKAGLNQAKKDADAISAYAISESLWYLTRQLPENHAVMVCLGEGLMPKAGETPEMGSNPQIGFGRVYARPQVAKWLDQRVVRLLNDESYGWDKFYLETKQANITIWGAAVDTLENTSRFAMGARTGPMTVLHIFDQPLQITRPYEGYMGNLFVPREVTAKAEERSCLIDFRTPRALVVEAIKQAYPGIRRDKIHVWTLGGKPRGERIGGLWEEWRKQGVHIVEDGWRLPTGLQAFTDSGTYAPTYLIGTWKDEVGELNLLICDGYAASAEAMQAASLAPTLDFSASLSIFTSTFRLPYDRERQVMHLDPESPEFEARLRRIAGDDVKLNTEEYRAMIRAARQAGLPLHKASITADDFFPEKKWSVLAVTGFMQPDPYTGSPGVELVRDGIYRVTACLAAPRGIKRITFTLRLMESFDQSKLIFNPLLIRFLAGENWRVRPVKVSDSGRIRNELQTLCSEALEFLGEERIRIRFNRIPPDVISLEKQRTLLEILNWYKVRHPLWFNWLEIA
jgi:hypothetical protein